MTSAERKSSTNTLPVTPRPKARFSLPDPQRAGSRESSELSTDRVQLESAEVTQPEVASAEEQEWKELVDTLRLHRRRLLRIPGVTAVDVGYKLEEKKRTFLDKLALRVHVERKLPEHCFSDCRHDFIDPKDYPSPRGKTVTMDVIEAEYRLVQLAQSPRPSTVRETPQKLTEVNRRRRIDPLVGGISIGSPRVPVGTLGALVWDREDGSVCILSNWHVLAGDPNAEVGNPCFQPGLFDHGRSSDVVARLKRWSFNRQTDAAIAELTGSRRYSTGEILSMFQTIKGTTAPYLGMKVRKSGRSTGFTWGFIDGLFFSAAIEYSNGVVQVFEEQIHIAPLNKDEPISKPGDSGSVWVTNDPDPEKEGYFAVGLHFAGDLPHSPFGEYALANPMSIVEKRLNFSFRPLFLEIRQEDVVSSSLPSAPEPVQIQLGSGAQPMSIVVSKLTGTGTQPDQVRPGGGG
jgi:endonuclease G, mitochondrial